MDLRALSTVVVMSLLASCGQAELEPEADREAAAPAASNQQLPAARLQMVASPVQQYSRLCDGSAVVAISDDLFLVGNDEKDTLQFYRLGQADPVAQSDALIKVLGGGEPDIEGAARIGDTIYWIASHGRNKKEAKPKRRAFAMTRIAGSTVVPEGAPYRLIVEDLAAAPATAALKLADKADIPAEDPDGLNIEGLAATADGAVLVGFRNPQPGGKALVARLANPSAIVLPAAGGERADRAKIDALFPLDLGGRGIRSIDYSPSAKRYLIAAGPYANDGDFALYAWNGGKDAPVKLDVTLPDGFKAEALAELAPGRWLVLSDDGTDECKDGPAANRAFRALVLTAQ